MVLDKITIILTVDGEDMEPSIIAVNGKIGRDVNFGVGEVMKQWFIRSLNSLKKNEND